jgi:hypothetical protein
VNKFTRALPSPGHWLGPAAGLAGSSSPHGLSCTQPQKNTKIKNNKKNKNRNCACLRKQKKKMYFTNLFTDVRIRNKNIYIDFFLAMNFY